MFFSLSVISEQLFLNTDNFVFADYPPAAKVAIIITESKIPGVSSVTSISRSWVDIIITFVLCLTLQYSLLC